MNIKDVVRITARYDLLMEAAKKDNEEHMEARILDPEDFIKKNPSTKEITSSIFFNKIGQPNPEGLLSNTIFGITREERAGIYGYIDLNDYFIHPLIYKKLTRLDKAFKHIIHGTKTYIIDKNGYLVEDDNGKTGIRWLKSNIDNIKFRESSSGARKKNIEFIINNKKIMFMKKLIVIPAYYRDVNTEGSGKVSVGEINELYASIITNVRGIKETSDFGLDVSDAIRGRIQEGILAVYDWLCGNNNDALEGAAGLSKKLGIIRMAGKSKTTDFGSRLVLSAPNLRVESIDDMNVDIQHCAVPLSSLLANFLPFAIYHIKRWLDNNFAEAVPAYDHNTGKITYIKCRDHSLIYSDEVIKEKIDNFIHSYSNRLVHVEYIDPDTKKSYKFGFGGLPIKEFDDFVKGLNSGESKDTLSIHRCITWCDVFFITMTEILKDKHVIVTRYPIDSLYNQFPSKANISSTKETEPIYIGNTYYPNYPKIREEMIGKDTSNMFIDTLRISNLLLAAIGGDYDGDQVSCKGVFTKEANEDCEKFLNCKFNYISMDGTYIRKCSNEAVEAVYCMTICLKDDKKKLTQNIEF